MGLCLFISAVCFVLFLICAGGCVVCCFVFAFRWLFSCGCVLWVLAGVVVCLDCSRRFCFVVAVKIVILFGVWWCFYFGAADFVCVIVFG